MDRMRFSRPLDMKKIVVEDEFWNREQELVRTEVIPYQWEALNDRVEGAAPSYCMHNFRAAGKLMRAKKKEGSSFIAPKYTFRGFEALPDDPAHPEEDKFYGFVFQDTDFSKWIEAVGYSLVVHPDPELEKIADGAIDVVCDAQLENGYLDTYYIINGMDMAFTNLRDHHELYCLGHLVEGAVSYYQATGKDKLLNAAKRFADDCCDYCGVEEGKCKGYPGHEIAEMALVKLYEATGEERYLKLAEYFINQRGQQPIYFEEELKMRAERNGEKYQTPEIKEDSNWFQRTPYWYHQAHKPVREQDEAVGHAVRAVYLYSGMADVARETNDEKLYEACERLWNSIVKDKLYITGGIGGSHMGESFSFPYDLPNDTAYSETCAAIGLVFFARRMLQLEANSKYADIMELSLYNTVLAGMALDGKSFFYVNPLEVNPIACDRDERKLHVKMIRQKWFGCACCPPNIARTLSSLSSYVYTESDDTLYTHLYIGSTVKKKFGEGNISLKLSSEMPWEGNAKAVINGDGSRGRFAFRIPGWSKKSAVTFKYGSDCFVVNVDGNTAAVACNNSTNDQVVSDDKWTDPICTSGVSVLYKDGYLYFDGLFKDVEIIFDFDMQIQLLSANNNVREDVGRVAVKRGPVTYCLEEIDNGKNLHLCFLDMEKVSAVIGRLGEEGSSGSDDYISETHELGHKMIAITLPGKREAIDDTASDLYRNALLDRVYEDCSLRFIPYYAWNNRGVGEMSVFVRMK